MIYIIASRNNISRVYNDVKVLKSVKIDGNNVKYIVLLYLAAPCCRDLDIFQLGTDIRTPIL